MRLVQLSRHSIAFPSPEGALREPNGLLALGGDLDGCETLPEGMHGLRDYEKLELAMKSWGFDDSIVENLFYKSMEKVVTKCIM